MTRGQARAPPPVTKSLPDLTFFLRNILIPALSIRKYAIAITSDIDIKLPPIKYKEIAK
jgi:hypothetical protein